jgi:hypothetical protein
MVINLDDGYYPRKCDDNDDESTLFALRTTTTMNLDGCAWETDRKPKEEAQRF